MEEEIERRVKALDKKNGETERRRKHEELMEDYAERSREHIKIMQGFADRAQEHDDERRRVREIIRERTNEELQTFTHEVKHGSTTSCLLLLFGVKPLKLSYHLKKE